MEKKKNKHFIIPPSYFKAIGITPIPVEVPSKTTQNHQPNTAVNTPTVTPVKKQPEKTVQPQPVSIPKIAINKPKGATSGLSLRSIKEKKEYQIKQLDVVVNEDDLPKEPVTQDALTDAWNNYVASLHKKGEKILASILEMEAPKIETSTIHLTYSNQTNKIELERAQNPLMAYLRKQLKNYDLNLSITVDEEIAKKYAFTTQEKFEKLKEKNPNIELLRKTFGLDI